VIKKYDQKVLVVGLFGVFGLFLLALIKKMIALVRALG